ncbi:DNA-3-methyladenine glycosylase I [Methanobrevibacter sp.]
MSVNDGKKRCSWCNLDNDLYVKYHDEEWGVINFDERYLFEMLVLESFQAGLSWETVLNKREAFRRAYDNFDIDKVVSYNDKKIEELENNQDIIRNKLKIKASINNGKVFKKIQNEFGSFHNYLMTFIPDEVIYENHKTSSPLSDDLSKDLKKRGMKFIGPTIIYSYLQAIGVINSHDDDCFMHNKNNGDNPIN